MVKTQNIGEYKEVERFNPPIVAGGNIYRLKKTCKVCGLLIRNTRAKHSQYCRDTGEDIDNKKWHRSKCQKKGEAQNQAIHRARYKAEGITREYECHKSIKATNGIDRQLRECLRCDEEEDGTIPKFMSDGPYHRICDSCSNKDPGMNVSNISRIGAGMKVKEISFMY